ESRRTASQPELGTLEHLPALAVAAERLGVAVALDLANQTSPDHPLVREHPNWFRQRPDGTVQYAENPPKKYQDIYPFDFESEECQGLWSEPLGIVGYSIPQPINIYRL